VDAGYYPLQVREKGELSKHYRWEHQKRRAGRTRLGREGTEKPFQRWRLWNRQARTSEANSIALPILLWQKITTSNGTIRKKKKSKMPIIEANRGCAKLKECGGKKQFSIVGPMQEGEGS